MTYPYDGDAAVGMIASAFLPEGTDPRRIEPVDAVFEALLDSIANLKEGDPIFEGTPHFLQPAVFENGAWFKSGAPFLFDTTSTVLISTSLATIATTGILKNFGEMTVEDGAFLTVKDGGKARVQGGGVLNFNSDGACNFDDSSTLDLFSTSVMTVHSSASAFVFGLLQTDSGSHLVIENGTNAELRTPLFHLGEGRQVQRDMHIGGAAGTYTVGCDDASIVIVDEFSGGNADVILKEDGNQILGDYVLVNTILPAAGVSFHTRVYSGSTSTDIARWLSDGDAGSGSPDRMGFVLARYNGTRWHAVLWSPGADHIG